MTGATHTARPIALFVLHDDQPNILYLKAYVSTADDDDDVLKKYQKATCIAITLPLMRLVGWMSMRKKSFSSGCCVRETKRFMIAISAGGVRPAHE